MIKPIVDLFYLSPNPYGGWVTFTAHLMAAFRAVDISPRLFKVRPRSEHKPRKFGYGEDYRNISMDEALCRPNPRLIVAAAKNFHEDTEKLLNAGARLVLHDPTELKNLPDNLDTSRTVVVRLAGLESVPGAVFIQHPYQRMNPTVNSFVDKSVRAVSTSRIDFDKHTDVILDANRLLKVVDVDPIRIYGFENRLYTRFKICPHYPEWEQSKASYPRDRDAAFKILQDAELMVDMSIIKGDGGGTQYTTLEAWDAGAVPVIQQEWLRPDGVMVEGFNCVAVDNAEGLAGVVTCLPSETLERCRENALTILSFHHPKEVGELYQTFMEM